MMLKLLFSADGPRDEATLPPLVGTILSAQIASAFEPWKGLRLQGGGKGLGGYGRKLLFLIRDARDRGASGVVATVDADRDKTLAKLKDLVEARNRDRAAGNTTPAAIGEAIPHLEAWLLDDDVAVRTALNLPSIMPIEAPTKVKSPKEELNRLHESCSIQRSLLETLKIIATEVAVERCIRADHTGFREFKQDVVKELGHLCGA